MLGLKLNHVNKNDHNDILMIYDSFQYKKILTMIKKGSIEYATRHKKKYLQ